MDQNESQVPEALYEVLKRVVHEEVRRMFAEPESLKEIVAAVLEDEKARRRIDVAATDGHYNKVLVQRFLDERIVPGDTPGDKLTTTEMHELFVTWCLDRQEVACGSGSFAQALAELAPDLRRKRTKDGRWWLVRYVE